MWLMFARAPQPDAPFWPGRRAFALIDAVVWPAAWAAMISGWAGSTGLVGLSLTAWCAVSAARRGYRAVALNHRYHFTTWRWGRWCLLVLVYGYAMKLAAVFSG